MSYAGDLTPTEAWAFLLENPDAVLVDVRTVAEWETVGIPDLSSLERLVVFDEWVPDASGRRSGGWKSEGLPWGTR